MATEGQEESSHNEAFPSVSVSLNVESCICVDHNIQNDEKNTEVIGLSYNAEVSDLEETQDDIKCIDENMPKGTHSEEECATKKNDEVSSGVNESCMSEESASFDGYKENNVAFVPKESPSKEKGSVQEGIGSGEEIIIKSPKKSKDPMDAKDSLNTGIGCGACILC